MKVVLIACCSKKQNKPCEAKDLYVSSLFKLSYDYAKSVIKADIFL